MISITCQARACTRHGETKGDAVPPAEEDVRGPLDEHAVTGIQHGAAILCDPVR